MIRNKGNHTHSQEVAEKAEGEIILAWVNDDVFNVEKYGPCPWCFVWLKETDLKKHGSRCKAQIQLRGMTHIWVTPDTAGSWLVNVEGAFLARFEPIFSYFSGLINIFAQITHYGPLGWISHRSMPILIPLISVLKRNPLSRYDSHWLYTGYAQRHTLIIIKFSASLPYWFCKIIRTACINQTTQQSNAVNDWFDWLICITSKWTTTPGT